MVRNRLTNPKSTGHQPTGQLALWDVTPPHSQEEEPFEMEIVVPESPEAQDAPAEEPEQQQVEDDEDDDDEEYYPLSDSESEKLYRDTDERESYEVEAPVSVGKLQALPLHLGITIAPKYRIKGVPCPGWVEY
jgi:hypothetical protein